MKTLTTAMILTSMLLVAREASANAPPPWFSCEQLVEGDSCDPYGADHGTCTLQASCDNDPATLGDECLWCVADPDAGGCQLAAGGRGQLVALIGLLLAIGLLLPVRRRRRR